MKHFLVPTDFSEAAENALLFAVESTRYIPARITLVHAFELVNNMYVDYFGTHREFHTDLTTEIEEKLNAIGDNVRKKHGIEIDTLVSKGSLQTTLSSVAKEKNTDMFIMGTMGIGRNESKLWGSRTSSVIAKSPLPVMAIPHEWKWEKPGNILLATNQFVKSSPILNFIFELAGLYLSSVHTTVFTREEDKADTFIRHQKEIREYGDFLKEKYKEDSLSSAHLYGNDFEETLEKYLSEHKVDILTMITRQKSFWQNLFDPSMTRKMSFHTKIPLLAIPEDYGKDH